MSDKGTVEKSLAMGLTSGTGLELVALVGDSDGLMQDDTPDMVNGENNLHFVLVGGRKSRG